MYDSRPYVEERSSETLRERPLLELLGEVSELTLSLVKQEVRLASLEVERRVDRKLDHGKTMLVSVGLMVAAGLTGLYALNQALTAFLLVGLEMSPFVATWLAPLFLTLGLGAIGLVSFKKAKEKIQEIDLTPKRAIEQSKEDLSCLKN